jgi:hypothetical protein
MRGGILPLHLNLNGVVSNYAQEKLYPRSLQNVGTELQGVISHKAVFLITKCGKLER